MLIKEKPRTVYKTRAVREARGVSISTERADGSPSTDCAAHGRAVRLPANPLPLDATSPVANAPLSYKEKGNSLQNETSHYRAKWYSASNEKERSYNSIVNSVEKYENVTAVNLQM